MHNIFSLVVALILLPLFNALLIALFRKKEHIRNAISIICSFLGLYAAGLIIYLFYRQHLIITTYGVLNLGYSLNFTLQVEGIGIIFAFLVSMLWPATIFYTIGYLRNHRHHTKSRFFFFLSLSITATFGIAFAGNLFTTFIFYEALTLFTYPLVVHNGKEKDKEAGRIYLLWLIGPSMILFLPAVILTFRYTGSITYTIGGLHFTCGDILIVITLLMYLFGVSKAALMPFHRWLPRAMVAPAPASALLHAVAVVKSGIFILIKIVIYIFGINNLHTLVLKLFGFNALLIIPIITIILASLFNIFNDNFKKILAYSTITQLAYIILCVLLFNKSGIIAAIMYLIAHSLAKIVLFFIAGAVIMYTGKENIRELVGVGKKLPSMMTYFTISAFSIIGLPFTSGFTAKYYLISAIFNREQYLVVIVLVVSGMLMSLYMFRIIYYACFAEVPSGAPIKRNQKLVPLQLFTMHSVIAIIVGINVGIFFVSTPLVKFVTRLMGL